MSSMLTALAERWRDALELFEEMIEERVIIYIYISFAETHHFFLAPEETTLESCSFGGGKVQEGIF